MNDDTLDPDSVPTKPLPVPADVAAPTEPLNAAPAVPQPVATIPPARPTWIAPALIVGFFALLLVIAVMVVPVLLDQRAEPLPTGTPTLATPTPTVTEEAPQQEQPTTEEPPAVVEPEPTEVVPEPTEPPVDPEPTPSATP